MLPRNKPTRGKACPIAALGRFQPAVPGSPALVREHYTS